MKVFGIILLCILSVALVSVLIICLKSGRFLKSLLLNSAIGIFMLIAINLLSNITGTKIPINEYTVLLSTLCGIPGIILIFLLPLIL